MDFSPAHVRTTVAVGGGWAAGDEAWSINAVFSLRSYLLFDVLPAWKAGAGAAA